MRAEQRPLTERIRRCTLERVKLKTEESIEVQGVIINNEISKHV